MLPRKYGRMMSGCSILARMMPGWQVLKVWPSSMFDIGWHMILIILIHITTEDMALHEAIDLLHCNTLFCVFSGYTHNCFICSFCTIFTANGFIIRFFFLLLRTATISIWFRLSCAYRWQDSSRLLSTVASSKRIQSKKTWKMAKL